jgi:hypothetical protein
MDKAKWHMKGYLESVLGTSRDVLLPVVTTALTKSQAERNAKRDTDHLHPSDLAKTNWCPRATYYKITKHEESNTQVLSLQRMNILEEGHRIHDKWQRLMWDAGVLKGDWRCRSCGHVWLDISPKECIKCKAASYWVQYNEVPIQDDDYHVIGHADGIVSLDKDYLIEIKSVGMGTLRWEAPSLYNSFTSGEISFDDLWKQLRRPLHSHNRQVQLYMHFLGIHDALVLYEWKPTQDVKEFNVKYSPEVVAPMLAGAKVVLNALEDELAPPRPEGFMKSKQCRFCAYKDACWSKTDG